MNSSDFYKIYAKEQLHNAQKSELGIKLGENVIISAIGQADDTALVSNNLNNIQYLLSITENFCKRFNVKICADKTKLLVYHTKDLVSKVKYAKMTNKLTIDGETVPFVDSAEHVGIVRSTSGNQLSIFSRITAHKKVLGAVLHTGVARGHRGNPAASLRVEQLYGVPVLLSGVAPLILNKAEVITIEQHHKETIENIQRLFSRTPRAVTFFLAGSLPASALLHLRQLTLFGMISRLPNNILHKHASNVFKFATNTRKSWFTQIRQLCLCYGLPHPSCILLSPPTKEQFKKLIKSHVIDYWETTLLEESVKLKSLTCFHPCICHSQSLILCGHLLAHHLQRLPWPLYRHRGCQENIELSSTLAIGHQM